jgi:hypothetical protein
VAGLLSDARPLDTGPAPRRNTEGGIQSADKSLINRRLKRSISCSVQIPLSDNGFDLLDRSKWSLLPGRCFLPLTTDIRTTFRRKIDIFANSDTDGHCRQCRTKETTSPGAAGEAVKEESNMG